MLTDDVRTDMIPIVPREPQGHDTILTAMLLWILGTCAGTAMVVFFTAIAVH